MTALIVTLHVITCFALIAVVLLQHGRGADIGAAFGAGASQTVFGSRGAGDFLTRLTTGAAIVFMLTSLTLSYFVQEPTVSELLDEEAALEESAAPAEDTPEAELIDSELPASTPLEGAPAAESAPAELPEGYEEIPLEGRPSRPD